MLKTCLSCEGFLPGSTSTCPHCGAAVSVEKASSALSGIVKGMALLATGGAMAVTLMACYGLPPCDDDPDGDGYCGSTDCDETNPEIHRWADDPKGDGIDQNCDGVDGDANEVDAGDGGPLCLTCAQAIGTVGTTQSELCEGPALTAFQALDDCACNVACAAVCQDNYCTANAASTDCQSCIDTQCAQQKLDCSEN